MYSNVWGVVKCKKRVLTQYCLEVKSCKNTDYESTYVRIFHPFHWCCLHYKVGISKLYENCMKIEISDSSQKQSRRYQGSFGHRFYKDVEVMLTNSV